MADYPVLELSGSADELEIATAFLLEQGCLGTEQHDGDTSLLAYFPPSSDITWVASEVHRHLPFLSCHVAEPVPERDWLTEWKEGLEGFRIGSRYFVLPTWRPEIETDLTVLRLDPEQAFGTGTHETTQLSVELLEDYVRDGTRVIDVGTGTGILAMVAAHERAGSVVAFDSDEAAVACAWANVKRNGLSDRVRVEHASWEQMETIAADVVVANINTSILERAVHVMYGTLLLSGILAEEVEAFVEHLPDGCDVIEARTANEWAGLVLRRAIDG